MPSRSVRVFKHKFAFITYNLSGRISRFLKMMSSSLKLLCVFLFLVNLGLAADIGKLLRLDGEKTQLLEELKERIYPKIKEEYMKNDWFFYQFLKEKEWNLEKAELALMNYIVWREENNMEHVHEEDWTEFRKQYPYSVDGVDKFGRPVLTIDFDLWDVSKIVSNEDYTRKFFRYFNKIFDEATRKVLALQDAGKNTTDFFLLVDMDKISASSHVNVKHSVYYWEACNHMEKYFPGMMNNILTINTPSIFEVMSPVVRYIFSDETNEKFKNYGGKNEWKSVLDNFIDPKELRPKFGGVKGVLPVKKPSKDRLVGTFEKNKHGQWVWG